MGGDLDMTAVGTVTYVDGDKVLAFGHPFYNLGAVDFPMTRVDVLTVVPSVQSSFKLGATGPMVGRISQDRTAGAVRRAGQGPAPHPRPGEALLRPLGPEGVRVPDRQRQDPEPRPR